VWAQVDHELGLFPYHTAPHERVLVLGAGGGFDVLLALRGGAQTITAVEINPDVLRAAERFLPPARNVYRVPTVQVVRGEGRHVVRQTTQQYDLIVLTQVYTGVAEQRSVALAENYVLTTEAFQDYLTHLTPQGRLVVQVHDAAEALKTVFMALGALQQRGLQGPAALQHVMVLQHDPGALEAPDTVHYPLVLLKNTPYTLAESRQQASLAQEMHLTPLFIPHVVTGFLELLTQSVATLSFSALPMTWQPATDDRPFFYETAAFPTGIFWLLLVTVLLLLGLHLWYYARQRPGATTALASTGWLPCFAGTGCAALLAQVALVQRSMLVLGAPTLTVVVLLVPLLCGGGMGSLVSTALGDHTLRWVLPWSYLMLGVLLCVYLTALPPLLTVLEKHALLVRSLGTMGLLVPVGMLMGVPFPTALRLLAPLAAAITPWAWGVNAVACVLGSVAAVGIAVAWGLQAVLSVSALVYVGTGWWAYYLLGKMP
jgi:protein-L-isoaspartate O-methyltransferase